MTTQNINVTTPAEDIYNDDYREINDAINELCAAAKEAAAQAQNQADDNGYYDEPYEPYAINPVDIDDEDEDDEDEDYSDNDNDVYRPLIGPLPRGTRAISRGKLWPVPALHIVTKADGTVTAKCKMPCACDELGEFPDAFVRDDARQTLRLEASWSEQHGRSNVTLTARRYRIDVDWDDLWALLRGDDDRGMIADAAVVPHDWRSNYPPTINGSIIVRVVGDRVIAQVASDGELFDDDDDDDEEYRCSFATYLPLFAGMADDIDRYLGLLDYEAKRQ